MCPIVGMGCRGCYGSVDDADDHGARVISALAATIDVGAVNDDDEVLRSEIEAAMRTLVDPIGTVYRFSLAKSLLRRTRLPGFAVNEQAATVKDHREKDQH